MILGICSIPTNGAIIMPRLQYVFLQPVADKVERHRRKSLRQISILLYRTFFTRLKQVVKPRQLLYFIIGRRAFFKTGFYAAKVLLGGHLNIAAAVYRQHLATQLLQIGLWIELHKIPEPRTVYRLHHRDDIALFGGIVVNAGGLGH